MIRGSKSQLMNEVIPLLSVCSGTKWLGRVELDEGK